MRTSRIWAGALVAVAAMLFGYAAVEHANPLAANAADAQALGKVDDFRLADANLEAHELSRLKGAKAIVLFIQGNGCPVVRNTMPALHALRAEYAARGVEFLMINPTLTDTRQEVLDEAKEFSYTIPIARDINQLVGEQLGVTRTAETFVVDPSTMKIVYRGPLDDRVTYERQKAAAEKTWAKDALDALLAGRAPAVSQVNPEGCLISFPAREARAAAAIRNISYARTIAPIIKEKCIVCHQPGGIGPMQLTSYERIKAYAPMIRETIRTQRMPPFHADPEFTHLLDDKRLSPDQIKTLVHWIEAGAPRGSGADPLASVTFQAPEWPLGKPDAIVTLPAFTIPATGIVDYQQPVVAYPVADDRWLRATTIKVGQRQGVHHILTSKIPVMPANGRASMGGGPSIGGYAVGSESSVMPANLGSLIPGGGAVVFQNHYTPFGREAVDVSQIGLYFYPKGREPALMMRTAVVIDAGLNIPANTLRHEEVAYLTFPKDALLYGIFPHAHYRATNVKVSMITADGKETMLLALPRYDFNWQREYAFATPIRVPAGAKIVARYIYDNSRSNPANPNPNTNVTWGEQSHQEMLYTPLRYRWVDETVANRKPEYETALMASRTIGMMDDNLDGKLQLAELKGTIGASLRPLVALGDTNKDGALDAAEIAAAQSLMGGARGGRAGGAAPATPAPPVSARPGRPVASRQ